MLSPTEPHHGYDCGNDSSPRTSDGDGRPAVKKCAEFATEKRLWDLDDDPEGNVQHYSEHGVSKEEIEEVFQNATDTDISQSSGRPVVFGDTDFGRHLMVAFEEIDSRTVYPVTAYEVPRKLRR